MTQWIISFIEQHGYLGVAALMALENIFPPIPSELIMPFAGFEAARGGMTVAGVILAGSVGSLLGTLPWYVVGRLMSAQALKRWAARHGRWLTLSPEDIESAERWFERHGQWAVFFGRLVPAVRSIISIPAGLAGMRLPRFLLWSTLGSVLWVSALVSLGYVLQDRYEQVSGWLDPAVNLALVGVFLAYAYRVATFGKARA